MNQISCPIALELQRHAFLLDVRDQANFVEMQSVLLGLDQVRPWLQRFLLLRVLNHEI